MLNHFTKNYRKSALAVAAALLAGLSAASLSAQSIETIDPNMAVDADLSQSGAAAAATVTNVATDAVTNAGVSYDTAAPSAPSARYEDVGNRYANDTLDLPPETYPAPAGNTVDATVNDPSTTYGEDDLIGAAEGLFGRGAEGLARVIQNVLGDQGEPNGYIVGREGSGAFILGVRYGSGTLFHAVEGNKPVYWTGPSIGFDAGANAGNTFVLIYNLDDSEDLYRRFPAGEGQAYFVGGFTASYMRRGNIVLIPIRVGAGLRLGINAGYMRFSHNQRWLPF